MRIFITGATGFVGSAVVQELLTNGHSVIGLARSEASAAALKRAGAGVHRGSLVDLDSLKRGASEADGIIHCAFDHDFSNFAANASIDQAAIEALGSALVGSDRPLVVTGGTVGLAPGRLLTEEDVGSSSIPRKSQEAALALAARGVRASVVRLSPSVHGDGDHGMVPLLVKSAREKGFATYVGAGDNRWSAVHRLDAARLFRLVLERADPGTVVHAVGDEGDPMRSIAEVIGRVLRLPVQAVPEETFGFLGNVFALDQPSSSAWTREKFDWRPTHPSLLADLEAGNYPA